MSGVLKISIAALVWLSHLVLQAQEPLQFDSIHPINYLEVFAVKVKDPLQVVDSIPLINAPDLLSGRIIDFPINYLDLVEVNQVQHSRSTIPALVIESSDIKRLSPLNVADVLRQCAGVQVKDYGGIGGIKTINIRSMGSQHTGIFYDGFLLGNAQNGQIDLGQLSMETVSRISVHQGQRSSVSQSANEFGHASTVYISTSPHGFSPSNPSQHTRIKLQGGSSALQRLSLSQSLALTSTLTAAYHIEELTASGKYRFRYRRRNYDGTTAYDTTATRQNGDIQSLLAEADLYYEDVTDNAQIKAYTYHSNRGIPGAIVNNVWRGGERMSDDNTFVQGQWTHDFCPQYRVKAKAKYAHYRTHYINRDSTRYLSDDTFRQNEAYLSLIQAWSSGDFLSLSSSYDFTWNNLHADLPLFETPRRFSHQLSFAASTRSTHINTQVSLLGTDICDEHAGDRTHFRNLTPALYLRWMSKSDGDGLSLHSFVKQSFRMPTFNDLYYTDMGNSYLKPEKAWQFDVGMQYSKNVSDHHLSIFLDLYHNRVSNKIVAYPKGQQFRWTMLNLGKVEINGVDINLGYRYLHNKQALRIDLQYTAQQAIDVTSKEDPYYRDQIPYMPRHSGSFTAGYEFHRWQINYHFTYVGERWSQQENILYNHLEPWYTNDMNLQYQWRNYRLTAEVLNLFDQQYDVIANYPMPGRNYRFSLCAEF